MSHDLSPPRQRTNRNRWGTAARSALVAGTVLIAACSSSRSGAPELPTPLDPPALQAKWAATLSDVKADVASARYTAADSSISNFLETHPGTPQSAEALFWRAVLKLDPANRTGSAREALVAVDAYLAGGTALPNFEMAQVLRRTASTLESAQRPLPAPVRPVVSVPDSSERARSAEEILRLKTELEKVQVELDRIKKRIRP